MIIVEEQAGEEVAKKLLAPEIHEKIVLSSGHSLVEIEAREEFIGKSLKGLDIRNRFGVNVIAIKKRVTQIDEEGKVVHSTVMNDLPRADEKIEKGDILMVVGSEADIEKLALLKEVK